MKRFRLDAEDTALLAKIGTWILAILLASLILGFAVHLFLWAAFGASW